MDNWQQLWAEHSMELTNMGCFAVYSHIMGEQTLIGIIS